MNSVYPDLRAVVALIAFAALGGATSARAQTIDDATSGLTSPAATVTFDNVGGMTNGTPVSTQYAGQGVTFGDDWGWLNADPWGYGTPGIVRNNAYGQGYDTPLAMYFGGPVRGAAFRFRTNTGTSLFEAYLNGTLVGSFTASTYAPTGTGRQWYGFDETVTLDEVRVEAPQNDAFNLDNLQIGVAAASVPEPGTLVLLGSGLLGLMGLAVRRRGPDELA